MDREKHWNDRYSTTPIERLGWYREHLERSLQWIDELGLPPESPIIDIGAGASTLVDDLLGRGFSNVSALDVSEKALAVTRKRLGEEAKGIEWYVSDITSAELPEASFDLWHDRAVFHFLTDEADRDFYRRTLSHALRRSGHLLIGVFSPEAPPKCSGLPVERYTLEQLEAEFSGEFEIISESSDLHVTPGGVEQPYVYALFRRREGQMA